MPLINPLVTRLPNGVNDVSETNILNAFGQLDPTKYHVYFDDFDARVITDGTTVVWTNTLTSTGTIAVAAANNGTLVVTNANTDEDYNQSQRTTATWLPSVSKKFWFKARLKVSAAALTDAFVGLSVIDTTIIAASALSSTDAIGFFKPATDTSWTAYIRKDASTGSTSLASLGTVTSDTFTTVGMYYDGEGTAYCMVDDVIVGTMSNISATYWPDAQMSPSIAFGQEGTGGATIGTVDYVFFAAER